MQQINYNYKNYRAALLGKDHKDVECNHDTYIITNGKDYKTFSIDSERNIEFVTIFRQIIEVWEKEKESKMTRNEAIKLAEKCGKSKPWYEADIALLEALGLIKFEEEKKVEILFEFKEGNCKWTENYKDVYDTHGIIRLEEWTEGLVLWVGREIVYKSWEKFARIGDQVTIDTGSYMGNIIKIWNNK